MDDTVAVARRAREPQDAPSMFLCPTLTGRPYRGVHRTPETDRTRPPLPPRNRAAHMEKWRGVTFLAVPGCIGLGVYLFSNHHEHHAHEQPVRHRPNWLLDPPRARATSLKIVRFRANPRLTRFPFPTIRQAYSYMRRRLKQLPWGGDCALFEYGKCQEN